MSALDLICGPLPASKSHGERRFVFVPAVCPSRMGFGVVTIVQGRRDADSYALDTNGGQVLFAKLDDDADVYGVQCRRGQPVRCTCTGFAFKKTCKHCDTTRELLKEGVIPLDSRQAA